MDDLIAKAVLAVALAGAWATPATLSADAGDDQYTVAAGHYARGRWRLAVDEFASFRRDFPQHAKADLGLFYQAEAHVQLGQHEQSRTLLREYLRRTPQGRLRKQALFRVAESSYLSGDKDETRAGFEQFLAEFADDKLNAYVITYLGEIALAAGEHPKAKELFERSLAKHPQGEMQDDARFGLARVLEQQGDLEAAGRLYLAVSAKTGSPLADDAQLRLAARQYADADYSAAMKSFEAFETTFAASELRDRARLGRAWCMFQLGQFDKAQTYFEALQTSTSVALEARYWLGLTHKAQKNFSAAAKTLVAAAGVDETHETTPAMVFHAGDALRQGGQAEAAKKQFDRLLSTWPKHEWADDALLGQLRIASDAADHAAVDELAAAHASQFPESPLNRDVQRIRARSLLARQQYPEAAKLIETMLQPPATVEPIDRYLAALAYQGLARHEEALKALDPALTTDKSLPAEQAAELLADAQSLQASLLIASARFNEAIPLLEKILAAHPVHARSLKCRAEYAVCLARVGQLDKARSAYSEFVIKRPENELLWNTTQHLAEAAFAAGDFKWSSELFQTLTKEGVSPALIPKGLSGLGWSQYRGDELAAAAETFDRLVTQHAADPLAAEAAYLRGQILEKLDRSDAALAMYRRVIDKHSASKQLSTALLAAARLHDRLQQDREASQLYQRLTKDFANLPQMDAVLYEWAWVLRDLEQPQESDDLFERLRKEHPQSRYWADATFRLAERAYALRQFEPCGRFLAELLDAQPKQGFTRHVMFLQGQLAAATGQWPEVAKLMQQVVQSTPDDPLRALAEYWMAEAEYRQSRYDAAHARLSQVATLIGDKREKWMAMVPLRQAQVLAQQKKWKEAQEVAEGIATRFPEFEQQIEADYVIGRALASRGDFDAARAAYQKVVRSSTGGKTETAAMAQWMIGESYFHQKQYDAALREYLRVEILYAYPAWQSAALLQAGKCCEALGQWKQAAELYERLLKEHAETEFAGDAAPRLKIAKERAKDSER